MSDIARFLERLRGCSVVGRWNFHSRLTTESVAEHSFYVAVYALLLLHLSDICPHDKETMESKVVLGALLHDVEESVTGDLPTLVKREVGKSAWSYVTTQALVQLFKFLGNGVGTRMLNIIMDEDEGVHKYIKAADYLDSLMYARHEKSLGNKNFDVIELEVVTLLSDMRMSGVDKVLESLGYKFSKRVEMTTEMTHM